MAKKKIPPRKKAKVSRANNKSKGRYVCIIRNGEELSKQAFITRYSPNGPQLREDIIPQLEAYNTLNKTNWEYVKCTCFSQGELRLDWPFKKTKSVKDRYTDHKPFEIQQFGNYENRFKSEVINELKDE